MNPDLPTPIRTQFSHPGQPRGSRLLATPLIKVLYLLVLGWLFLNPFVWYGFYETWEDMGPDWRIFYPAASRMLEGDSPYPDHWLQGKPPEPDGQGWKDYIYPPFFARVVSIFVPLGYVPSMKVFLLVFGAISFYLLYPRFPKTGAYPWVDHMLMVGLVLGYGPLIQEFRHGQSDFIPLFMFLIAWRLLREIPFPAVSESDRWREIAAGVCFGVAFNVKLTPVLILPLLLVTGRYRIGLWFVISSVLLLVATGPVSSYQYFTRVFPTMLHDFADMRGRTSLHLGIAVVIDRATQGAANAAQWREISPKIGVLLTGLLLALVVWLFWKNRKSLSNDRLFLCAFFLPPVFAGELSHHYLLSLPPFLIAVHHLYRRLERTVFRGAREWGHFCLVLFFLLPSFYYWPMARSVCGWVESLHGFHPIYQLLFGQLVAFGLVLPVFLSDKHAPLEVPALGFGPGGQASNDTMKGGG